MIRRYEERNCRNAQRIKATLGITADPPKSPSTGRFGTDVGSSHPGAVVPVPRGWAVRPLKRYASWVQNVARQFGPLSITGVVKFEES